MRATPSLPRAALVGQVAFLLGLGCAESCPMPSDGGVVDAGDPYDAGPVGDPFHDPLSMPEAPTLDLAQFNDPMVCAECHLQHYEDWRSSMHSYAMVDPVFRKLVALRQAEFAGKQDQFCTQCHTPLGTRSGAIVDNFAFDDLPDLALRGVTCETCHKATEVARPFNSGLVIDPLAPMQGPLANTEPSLIHASAYNPLHESPELCAACHDVVEVSGLNLERPYQEFLESPGRAAGRTCQDCHMPASQGPAAIDGPERTLHSHRFIGVDVPLLDGFAEPERIDTMRQEVRDLLGGSAALSLRTDGAVAPGSQLDVFVTIENLIDSHALPTGSTNNRQMWVELTATDAEGRVLFRTGDLDENGDLRDAFSEIDPYGDNDLIRLSSTLVDEDGQPVLFSWRATEHFSNAISPLYERTFTLFVPVPDDVVGPVSIDARLLFRTHGPYLLRALELDDLVEKIEVYEVAADATDVLVADP